MPCTSDDCLKVNCVCLQDRIIYLTPFDRFVLIFLRFSFNSGLPITLTFGFCFATIAILMLDTEESCSRAGVLKRVPEEELSTPEEFLMAHAPISDTSDLVLTTEDDEEGRFVAAVDESFFSAAEDTKDDNKIASESTPLLTKDGLDV
jgi:hypothetical protein